MVVKRRKVGNTTVTINTRTGRQTTSRRSGNITYSQSNQGHNRSTQTFSFGNGWFQRKTTDWNKKSPKKRNSSWSLLPSIDIKYDTEVEKKARGGPLPKVEVARVPWGWEVKRFNEYGVLDWIGWFLALPFRALWHITRWTIILILVVLVIKALVFLVT